MHVYGCKKLVHSEGSFKVESIAKVEEETINNLGLFYLESMKNIEVKLLNCSTTTEKKGPIQVLHESGLFSIFLPGSNAPSWFNYKNAGSSVSFTVPSVISLRIRGLNICCVYAIDRKNWYSGIQFYTLISNMTKDLKLIYSPTCYGFPEADEDMIWLSYWKFQSELEAGDELSVSLLTMAGFEAKEIGVRLLYEEQERMDTSSISHELTLKICPFDVAIPPSKAWMYQRETRLYFFGNAGLSPDYVLPYLP